MNIDPLGDDARRMQKLLERVEEIDAMLKDPARYQTMRGRLKEERDRLWSELCGLRLAYA